MTHMSSSLGALLSPAPTSVKIDRRKAPRRRVLKKALIILDNKQSTMSCVVIDMNEAGARLRMPFSAELPLTFMLAIKGEEVIRPVKRIWSGLREIGVRFL